MMGKKEILTNYSALSLMYTVYFLDENSNFPVAQFNWVLYNPKKGLFVVESIRRLKYKLRNDWIVTLFPALF